MEKILIVEDSVIQSRMLADLLLEHDFITEMAADGETALQMLSVGSFDILLMDMVLPDISGLGLLKKIDKLNIACKPVIIALSGVTDKENIIKSLGLGIDDYLTKPYHPAELLARIHTHLEKKKALKKLAQINQANDRFLMVLGHDLKNYFTSLHSSIHLLDKIAEPIQQQDLIGSAKAATRQVNSLLDDLLLWGRSINGGLIVKSELIDLNGIVLKCINQFQYQANEKKLRIDTHVTGEAFIYADAFMIETVIRNILSNAIKFTSPGNSITVSSDREFGNGIELYEVCISDSGIGMTDEKVASLFNGYFNSADRDADGNRGIGMGLVICKEFLQKNRGTIEVFTKLGEGSNFVISIPKANKVVP